MADPQTTPMPVVNAEEVKFRKDNLWHSFMASVYGAVGGASFFAVLNNVVGGMMKVAASASGTAASGAPIGFLDLAGLGGFVVPVMAGLTLVGIAATYLAQMEYTELKCIQDERLARKNAECMEKRHNDVALQQPACAKAVTYEQNCRSDNKGWVQAVNSPAQARDIARC